MSQTPSSSAQFAPPPPALSALGLDQLLALLMHYGIPLPQLPQPPLRPSAASVFGSIGAPTGPPQVPPGFIPVQGLPQTTVGQKRTHAELGSTETDEEDDGGDDEEEETDIAQPPRSRRSHKKRVRRTPPKKLLCGVRRENLSLPEQLVVRGKLQQLIKGELQLLTGIVKNKFPQLGRLGVSHAMSGQQADSSIGTSTNGKRVGPPMAFDFEYDADVEVNLHAIRRAAAIVWAEQGDGAMARTVPHPAVKFTQDDLEGFAKACFRMWRRKSKVLSIEERRAAWEKNKRMNRRSERQKRLRDDREKACEEYHGKNVQALLKESAYMSEEASDLDDATSEDWEKWKTELERAAGITERDREEGNVKVLEVVRPAYRPKQVNEIFNELDAIRRQQRRADPANARPRFRRVNCGRLCQDPPAVSVYPCLLDANWLKTYREENPYEDVYVLERNPPVLATLIGGAEHGTIDDA
ncbi:hypothetical protein LXA43DRAFT_1099958 [Ganoderma leucocontextum]|nr:hypothetical protein LXA43DRAFT_1099958 [Ganoderma leucocontextum]